MNDDLVVNGFCTITESLVFESKRCENKLPLSFWETYSAFANTAGGTIVLGFTETPEGRLKLTGVSEPEKIVRELWDLLHNRNKVSMNILTENDINVKEWGGLSYIMVRIPRAERYARPIFINDDLNGGTYRRNDSGDYHCSVPEIMEMGRDASMIPVDQRIVEESSMEWVNENTLDAYRNMLRQNEPRHTWLDEEDEEFLRLIGAANHSDGKLKLTQAGLLMFGNITEITNHIPGYNLNYCEYGSDDRWANRLHSDSGLWSGNVFDFYLEVTRRLNFSNKKPFRLVGDVRVGDNDIVAMQREALMNALVHADYQGAGGINVEFYGTKLVVRNPGCFLIPIEKAMTGGFSESRNPRMMRMFDLVGLTERMGSGLVTMMNICRENRLPSPIIEEENGPSIVRVTLTLDCADVPLKERVLMLMEEQPKISIDKMAKELGVSRTTVSRSIDVLKTNGRIRREDGRKGIWVVIKQ